MRRPAIAWLFFSLAACGGGSTAATPTATTADKSASASSPTSAASEAKSTSPTTKPAEPTPAACALDPLAGRWNFTTTVLAANQASALGARGSYELEITAKDCKGEALLRKVGYDGKRFAADKVVSGTASIDTNAPTDVPGTVALEVVIGEGKAAIGLRFALVARAEVLGGYWHNRGAQWERAGMSGVLAGTRTEAPAVATLDSQLCAVQCAVACDTARTTADGTAAGGLDACLAGCESGVAPTCVAATPLPDAARLDVEGPHASVDAFCASVGWRKSFASAMETEVDEIEFDCAVSSAPKPLGAGALGGSWDQASLVETSGTSEMASTGELRLALQSAGAWHVTAPLATWSKGSDPHASAGFRGAKLLARELASGTGHEVLASVESVFAEEEDGEASEEQTSTALAACARVAERAECVHVEGGVSLAFVAGGISISTADKDDPEAGALVGIFAWPAKK
jgi:hypothetical protein